MSSSTQMTSMSGEALSAAVSRMSWVRLLVSEAFDTEGADVTTVHNQGRASPAILEVAGSR
jgi:hypothetical protein